MVKGIFIASRGLGYRMKNIENVANNLANVNSAGYKREGEFYQIINEMGETKARQTRDYTNGNYINTSRPFDLAIRGEGFFQVKTEKGLELSRNGRFSISDEGFLVNDNGDKVMGNRGEINLSSFLMNQKQTVSISRNGEIRFGEEIVDNLKIATVEDLDALQKTGGSNYMDYNQNYMPAEEDKFEVLSGYIEESNVNAIYEMQKMIEINKEYEAAQKVINTIDASLDRLKEIGRV